MSIKGLFIEKKTFDIEHISGCPLKRISVKHWITRRSYLFQVTKGFHSIFYRCLGKHTCYFFPQAEIADEWFHYNCFGFSDMQLLPRGVISKRIAEARGIDRDLGSAHRFTVYKKNIRNKRADVLPLIN